MTWFSERSRGTVFRVRLLLWIGIDKEWVSTVFSRAFGATSQSEFVGCRLRIYWFLLLRARFEDHSEEISNRVLQPAFSAPEDAGRE